VEQVQEMLGHSVITPAIRYVHAAGRVERSAVHGLDGPTKSPRTYPVGPMVWSVRTPDQSRSLRTTVGAGRRRVGSAGSAGSVVVVAAAVEAVASLLVSTARSSGCCSVGRIRS
jgi:hypothetical protein